MSAPPEVTKFSPQPRVREQRRNGWEVATQPGSRDGSRSGKRQKIKIGSAIMVYRDIIHVCLALQHSLAQTAATRCAGEAMADAAPDAKRARTGGTMPPELRESIEKSLDALGQIELKKRSRKKGAGPVQAQCRPPEDLIHDKIETVRTGNANRVHYKCSNAACPDLIRNDKWDGAVANSCTVRIQSLGVNCFLFPSAGYARDTMHE